MSKAYLPTARYVLRRFCKLDFNRTMVAVLSTRLCLACRTATRLCEQHCVQTFPVFRGSHLIEAKPNQHTAQKTYLSCSLLHRKPEVGKDLLSWSQWGNSMHNAEVIGYEK